MAARVPRLRVPGSVAGWVGFAFGASPGVGRGRVMGGAGAGRLAVDMIKARGRRAVGRGVGVYSASPASRRSMMAAAVLKLLAA